MRSTLCLLVAFVACTEPSGGTSETDGGSTGATTDAPTTSAPTTTASTTDASTTASSGQSTADQPGVHFVADIWPILGSNCSCHFPSMDMTPGQYTVLELDEDPAVSYARLIDQPSSVAGLDYV